MKTEKNQTNKGQNQQSQGNNPSQNDQNQDPTKKQRDNRNDWLKGEALEKFQFPYEVTLYAQKV
jgi:hypothetical protein